LTDAERKARDRKIEAEKREKIASGFYQVTVGVLSFALMAFTVEIGRGRDARGVSEPSPGALRRSRRVLQEEAIEEADEEQEVALTSRRITLAHASIVTNLPVRSIHPLIKAPVVSEVSS